jgi:hypothetical protein
MESTYIVGSKRQIASMGEVKAKLHTCSMCFDVYMLGMCGRGGVIKQF